MRLEVHTVSATDDATDASFDAYCVFDTLSCRVRYVDSSMRQCEKWIRNNAAEYPDPDEDDDGLS